LVQQVSNEELTKLIDQKIKDKLKEDALDYYAESLTIPWSEINNGEGSWCKLPVPGLFKPYAHLAQRQMTYPFEDPKSFERFKHATYFINFAGNRGGKTVWDCVWPSMEAVGIHPLQKLGIRPKPPVRWWICSPNLPAEANIPMGEDTPIIKKFYEWSAKYIKKFYRRDKLLEWKGGSIFSYKSYEMEKAAYKSEEVDGVTFDEDPPKPLWGEAQARLIDRNGIILLGSTPDFSSVFTYEIRQKEINNPRFYFSNPYGAEDNPFLNPETRKQILDDMSPEERIMRGKGLHVQFQGKVFPFDRNFHVGKPFTVSNDCANYVIIDWHPAKPIYISYLSINAQNIWYVWGEDIIREKVISEISKGIFSRLTRVNFNLKVKQFIIDRLALIDQIQEETKKSKSIVDMLKEYGVRCRIGNPSFDSAHSFICDKMKHREFYIDPNCVVHIEQFDTWGAKRYTRGYLEGKLRDQLEVEDNDTCINMVYAYNAGARFSEYINEEMEIPWVPSRPATARLYGRAR
jgi:phage terminase large subunit-like protein